METSSSLSGRKVTIVLSSVVLGLAKRSVEVEVIRNVDGNDVSSAYRGSEAVAHRILEKIRGAPHALELDVEALGRGIEERIGHSPTLGHHSPIFGHHSPTAGHHRPHEQTHPAEDDDDEGWASDCSGGEEHDAANAEAGPSSSPDRGARRQRSKSPKTKPEALASNRRPGVRVKGAVDGGRFRGWLRCVANGLRV
ncbi:hypothetical protein C8R47DRAFT_1218984 [Mycena vitilis]|nr:hypothetical protein C8R47DRAFT_1218984 [Mycena vitilis]